MSDRDADSARVNLPHCHPVSRPEGVTGLWISISGCESLGGSQIFFVFRARGLYHFSKFHIFNMKLRLHLGCNTKSDLLATRFLRTSR